MSWRGAVRRGLPFLIAAAAGFLVGYLVIFFVVFPGSVVPTDARVPNVVGLDYTNAAARLQAAGFGAATGEQRFHPTAPRGTVLQQAPVAGAISTPATRIILDVSAGQREAEVPTVAGLPRQQAQVALENAGFDVGEVTEQSAGEGARGTVLATDPPSGTHRALPATVNLVVSSGPGTVTVPDLTGTGYAQARSRLEQLGLVVPAVRTDSSAAGDPNTVVAQTPAGGTRVPAGSPVRLTVHP